MAFYGNSVQASGVPITVTAGAGNTVIINAEPSSSNTGNLSPGQCLSTLTHAVVENSSLLTAATVVFTVQRKCDTGSWTDLVSETYTLRGLVGLIAADRVSSGLCAQAPYVGTLDDGIVAVRLVVSCTGASIKVLNASMHTRYIDYPQPQ